MKVSGNTLIEILYLEDLYTEYQDHERLTVFVNKGRECVACGRVGVLLLKTQDGGGRLHIDLFTRDFVLMTVDHITPKALGRLMGWSKDEIESLDNKQPMCSPCNSKKDDSLVTAEEMRKRQTQPPHERRVNFPIDLTPYSILQPA